jgi:hypothetical protein
MKKLFSAFVAGATIAGAAQATPVMYEYTATISDIFQRNPSEWMTPRSPVDSGEVLGHNIAKGAQVTGRFTVDTDTPHTQRVHVQEIPGHVQVYDGGNLTSLSADFDSGLHFNAVERSDNGIPDVMMFVNNDDYNNQDVFSIQGSAYNAPGSQFAALYFWDLTQSAFDSAELNQALVLDAFTSNAFSYYYTTPDQQSEFAFFGNITSLTTIPEPASALLMLSGLGLLAAVRRRKAAGAQ